MARAKRNTDRDVRQSPKAGNSPRTPGRWPEISIAVGLAVFAFILFLPNAGNEFSTVDDPEYVAGNPVVRQGVTLEGIRWAFTSEHFYNWLPVTTLSHMLDVELYGVDPVGHHVTNILLHSLNASLAFVSLWMLTGRRWLCAAVAVLFAVHPLRVESVAWIAERKDLLAGTFFFLTLITYVRYVRRPSVGGYAVVLLLLALGLMSKTMLVSLPCLLLLLDWWPLRRTTLAGIATVDGATSGVAAAPATCRRLVVEKLPMLALVVVASLWTLSLQRGGGATELTAELSFGQRLGNAVVGVWRYVGKMVLPVDQSPFYIHPRSWPTAAVVASALALIAVTAIVVWHGRRRPYLLAGWCWFLGVLFPVSGVLVHAGRQSIAERYTYLSSIGLLVVLVWGIAELSASRPLLRRAAAVGFALAVVGYSAATARYQSLWQNDVTLYVHALNVDPDNWFAHQVIGNQLRTAGRDDLAADHFRKSLAKEPGNHRLRLEQATMLLSLSPETAAEAAKDFRIVVQAAPDEPGSWVGLARAELAAGRGTESDAAFAEAARRWPANADILAQWSASLLRQGRTAEARDRAEAALRVDPANEVAKLVLARAPR